MSDFLTSKRSIEKRTFRNLARPWIKYKGLNMFFLGLCIGVSIGLIGALLVAPRVDDWHHGRLIDNSAEWQAFKKAFPVGKSDK